MNDREPLTGKQIEVFEVVLRAARATGQPVSLDEIVAATSVYDRGAASKIVTKMAEMNYVRRRGGHGGVELADGSGLVLPLPGLTAAGAPAETLTPDHGFFSFNDAFGGDGNFMLEVRGTSMVDACVADGDFLILRPATDAHDGQKVVCRLGDDGYTFKYLRTLRGARWLVPANETDKSVKAVKLDPDRDQIVGVLIGVVRRER